MSISTSLPVRCPQCAAQVTAGSDWCTLCYADLRPAPEPGPAPAAEPVAEPVAPVAPAAVADAPAAAAPAPRRGKHARVVPAAEADEPAPLTPTAAELLADQLIAELAVTEGGNRLGSLTEALDSTGKRVAVILGGTATGIVLLILLMWGVGALV